MPYPGEAGNFCNDRPDFWPEIEGFGETEEKFGVFQNACETHVDSSFEAL